MGWYGFRPYVSVARRRANATREVARMAKKGVAIEPVKIDARIIASTFWGKAWCDHLESYADFASRIPRGRTYVRNGSVVHLCIEPGTITSMVAGSELYRITIRIKPLPAPAWKTVKTQCSGQIGSLVELLQGRLSSGVMQVVTCREKGLFPSPREIEMSCSCPDYAGMCKHVAATLYGVGNRLDRQPDLLFKLRQVDHLELIADATIAAPVSKRGAGRKKTIAASELSNVFGIELDSPPPPGKVERAGKHTNDAGPIADSKPGARARSRSPRKILR